MKNVLWISLFLLSFSAFNHAQADSLIDRGQYLTQAGDCVSCHTASNGKAFAGGHAIKTPFGLVYAPNITPDIETGIGAWSFNDFWQALHNGKGREGQLLYPVFSYTSFTKVTQDDARAIFAYLQSLPAVSRKNTAPQLDFPYNIRPLLYAWRALYFSPGVYQADKSKSDEWNRGAYLVEGLGHCNECHTSRNALGAMNKDPLLAGGEIPLQGWYAPNLSMQKGGGLADWNRSELMALLKTGISAKGGVFGPMADVVRNSTQYLSDADLNAIATYLQSLPAPESPAAVASSVAKANDYQAGQAIFEQHCSDCHGKQGAGKTNIYPPLSGNSTVTEPTGINAIRTVLLGGFPPATAGNPMPYSMPPFAEQLSDAEIAAVVNYIRQSWGNHSAPISTADVKNSRWIPAN